MAVTVEIAGIKVDTFNFTHYALLHKVSDVASMPACLSQQLLRL